MVGIGLFFCHCLACPTCPTINFGILFKYTMPLPRKEPVLVGITYFDLCHPEGTPTFYMLVLIIRR